MAEVSSMFSPTWLAMSLDPWLQFSKAVCEGFHEVFSMWHR